MIENWEKAALAFQNAQLWQKNADCWQNLARYDMVAIAYQQQKQWQKAAEIWLSSDAKDKIIKAALCYEQGLYWSLAEECWRKIAQWDKVAYTCEQQGEGKWEKAVEAWQLAGNKLKAANLLRKMGKWKQAALMLANRI